MKKAREFYFLFDLVNKITLPEQDLLINKPKADKQMGLFATDDIPKNAILYVLRPMNCLKAATTYTIQYDDNLHIPDESLKVAKYTNHGCDPNVNFFFVETDEKEIQVTASGKRYLVYCVAKKDIVKDEEIRFDYLTTEYDMKEKFNCSCGSPLCKKEIQGFKYLSNELKLNHRDLIAPHLKKYLIGIPDPRPKFFYFQDLLNKIPYEDSKLISVKLNAFKQNGVFANFDIPDGVLLFHMDPIKCWDKPDLYTVQYDDKLHISHPQLHLAKYTNHSCDPNIDFKYILTDKKEIDQTADGKRYVVYAMTRRVIPKDTEVTFDYTTTEFDMDAKFPCKCGSKLCRKDIQGFKHLNKEEQMKIKYRIAPHLKKHL